MVSEKEGNNWSSDITYLRKIGKKAKRDNWAKFHSNNRRVGK